MSARRKLGVGVHQIVGRQHGRRGDPPCGQLVSEQDHIPAAGGLGDQLVQQRPRAASAVGGIEFRQVRDAQHQTRCGPLLVAEDGDCAPAVLADTWMYTVGRRNIVVTADTADGYPPAAATIAGPIALMVDSSCASSMYSPCPVMRRFRSAASTAIAPCSGLGTWSG